MAASAAAPRPHLWLMLADDFGHANFGPTARRSGNERLIAEAQTPALQRLADDGILLTRHYANSICSPSRSALQSGRLPTHINVENAGMTVLNTTDPVSGAAGIPTDMTCIAEKLRDVGYRTHAVGKWDAGMATPSRTPRGRGYETFLGYYQHANSYWTKGITIPTTNELDLCLSPYFDLSVENATYRGGYPARETMGDGCDHDAKDAPCYEEHIFKRRAVEIVQQHDTSRPDAPLFLFYASHLAHEPLQVPTWYEREVVRLATNASRRVGLDGGRAISPYATRHQLLYAAMALYLDTAIDEVADALKARGMWQTTLMAFLSDNGGPIHQPAAANNWPLRGGKFSDFEGGVLTNAFVSGGWVPAARRGGVWDGVMSIADWYGTLCALGHGRECAHDAKAANASVWLAAHDLPALSPIDGRDMWPNMTGGLRGRESEPLPLSPHTLLVYPWKLITRSQPMAARTGPHHPNCTGPGVDSRKADCGAAGCLFDVHADPYETTDVAAQHPAVVAELTAALAAANRHLFVPHRGASWPDACDVFARHGGFYGPFTDEPPRASPYNWSAPSGYYELGPHVPWAPRCVHIVRERCGYIVHDSAAARPRCPGRRGSP